VNKHIPRGYDECLIWGTIGWTIPQSRYPDTYNKQPICYVALSSQKNYCSLYLFGAFWSASQLEQLKAAFKAAGKKLDMGKCCVHFQSPDDLPLEAIGRLISAISSEKWIEMYEQSRLKTKDGAGRSARNPTYRTAATKGKASSRLHPLSTSPLTPAFRQPRRRDGFGGILVEVAKRRRCSVAVRPGIKSPSSSTHRNPIPLP